MSNKKTKRRSRSKPRSRSRSRSRSKPISTPKLVIDPFILSEEYHKGNISSETYDRALSKPSDDVQQEWPPPYPLPHEPKSKDYSFSSSSSEESEYSPPRVTRRKISKKQKDKLNALLPPSQYPVRDPVPEPKYKVGEDVKYLSRQIVRTINRLKSRKGDLENELKSNKTNDKDNLILKKEIETLKQKIENRDPWISAKVEGVGKDGSITLNIKPDADPMNIRKLEEIPESKEYSPWNIVSQKSSRSNKSDFLIALEKVKEKKRKEKERKEKEEKERKEKEEKERKEKEEKQRKEKKSPKKGRKKRRVNEGKSRKWDHKEQDESLKKRLAKKRELDEKVRERNKKVREMRERNKKKGKKGKDDVKNSALIKPEWVGY